MGGSNPYIEEVKYKPATKKYKVTFLDRKSTRLNSSHSQISYAVFCLKKKNRARRAAERSSHIEQAALAHRRRYHLPTAAVSARHPSLPAGLSVDCCSMRAPIAPVHLS